MERLSCWCATALLNIVLLHVYLWRSTDETSSAGCASQPRRPVVGGSAAAPEDQAGAEQSLHEAHEASTRLLLAGALHQQQDSLDTSFAARDLSPGQQHTRQYKGRSRQSGKGNGF